MLSKRLLAAIGRAPDRICLQAAGTEFTYGALSARAAALVAEWARLDGERHPVAILADHSFAGYAALVAAIVSGRPYVPLKPGLPPERIGTILARSGARLLSGDEELIAPLLPALARSGARFVSGLDRPAAPPLAAADDSNPVAYIIFTSGSTGVPKGVVVRAASVAAYCTAADSLFPLRPDDRCTQLFDLSFDLSVHDVLVTLLAGARLVTDPARQRIDPVGFAAAAAATVWFSVPSVVSVAKRFRRLVPGALPALRLALFCGEALPVPLAADWVAAAPQAVNFNVYGPSEATIAITWYRFDRALLAQTGEASVPIGVPYPGSEALVVGEGGQPAAAGESGELWLGGPQLADGYLADAAQTADKFVAARFPGLESGRWYRTGDLACLDEGGEGLLFRGRIDHQVKIRGYRIELDEIENVIRQSGLVGEVSAFSYQSRSGIAALACAVTGDAVDQRRVLSWCSERLPDYSVPDRLLLLERIPLNQNGKVDRKALKELAEAHP